MLRLLLLALILVPFLAHPDTLKQGQAVFTGIVCSDLLKANNKPLSASRAKQIARLAIWKADTSNPEYIEGYRLASDLYDMETESEQLRLCVSLFEKS